MVKVWPRTEQLRKLLKHPGDNVNFREEGPANWPDDAFTLRRVEDGDVLLEDPNPPVPAVAPLEDPTPAEETKTKRK